MELIVYGLAIYYLVRVLLYNELGTGPFESKTDMVVYVAESADGSSLSKESRPVHLWDRIRLFFRAYTINDKKEWYYHSGLWVCPKCLSFWIALILLGIFLYYPIVLYPLAGAGFVSLLYDKS